MIPCVFHYLSTEIVVILHIAENAEICGRRYKINAFLFLEFVHLVSRII